MSCSWSQYIPPSYIFSNNYLPRIELHYKKKLNIGWNGVGHFSTCFMPFHLISNIGTLHYSMSF